MKEFFFGKQPQIRTAICSSAPVETRLAILARRCLLLRRIVGIHWPVNQRDCKKIISIHAICSSTARHVNFSAADAFEKSNHYLLHRIGGVRRCDFHSESSLVFKI